MSQLCRRCGPNLRYGDEVPLCPKHVRELEPYPETDPDPVPDPAPEPAPRAEEPTRDPSRCWNCGTAPPRRGSTECLSCHKPLTPPALLIRFRDGQVEVGQGARAELGRHGRYARVFRAFPNVSRRHAVVGVDPDGRGWIEPVPTPNGTFIGGREIEPSVRRELRDRQVVRFALHAEGSVTLFTDAGDGT